MEKDFELIYSTEQEYQAEIARELLEDNDIKAVILNKRDSMQPFIQGTIEVYVHKDSMEKAEEILKKLKS